ncbi:MAG: DUF58 domain-containing protein [Desulfobacteraceae bacterium]
MKLKFHKFIQKKIKSRAKSAPFKTGKGQIYILPTTPGFIFLCVILVIFAGSFNENNNMGLLFSFFLFFVFLLSIKETRNSILNLKINSIKIENSFAFSKAKVEFHLKNNQKEKKALQISLNDSITKIDSIKQNSSVRANLFIDSEKRGVYNSPVFTVYSIFPYGIFKSFAYAYSSGKMIVYPAPAKESVSLLNLKSLMENQGIIPDSSARDDEFKGLKEYEKGDSIKRISWKSYSKGLGLFTKDFGEEKDFEEIIIYFDKIKISDTEQKLSMICKTILDLELSGIKYGLEIKETKILPGSGRDHQAKCLEALAEFKDE